MRLVFGKRSYGERSIIDEYREMLRSQTHCEKRVQVQMLFLGLAVQKYWDHFIGHRN